MERIGCFSVQNAGRCLALPVNQKPNHKYFSIQGTNFKFLIHSGFLELELKVGLFMDKNNVKKKAQDVSIHNFDKLQKELTEKTTEEQGNFQ